MKIRIPTLGFLLSLFLLAGCDSPGAVDSNGMPKKLEIAVVQAENIPELKKVREEVSKFLEKKLGIPVEMIYTNDYTGVIEALKTNKVHMADIPPFAYIIATRSMKLYPLVTLGQNGKPSTYTSSIIVNGHSNLKSMADIKANSKNLTLCFVDPASTSGHLVPRAYLNTIGLNPDSAFKQVIFAGNHLASVLAVKSGKIDVGCTTSLVFNIMMDKKMINPGDVRVVWTSDPIMAQPIVIRDDVNKDFAKKIQDAYLSINKERPDIINKFVKLFLKDTAKRSYVVVKDADYDGLRKIAAGVKDLKASQ
ncbi:MAG TPA: phosphate/phosphite/phosphonate ABC transporter substrate-binding protein [Mucilaginibacter sp.]|jgi:phosphonate transport system substrate-binding protein|nr:phosphate/phosphite/phosphonate ABC transporter substrate-binding protein [Mucilaginibacter sp.]